MLFTRTATICHTMKRLARKIGLAPTKASSSTHRKPVSSYTSWGSLKTRSHQRFWDFFNIRCLCGRGLKPGAWSGTDGNGGRVWCGGEKKRKTKSLAPFHVSAMIILIKICNRERITHADVISPDRTVWNHHIIILWNKKMIRLLNHCKRYPTIT